ncbi:malto-oligosyltrehalose trehalohydrolase [Halochromatium glycolicum]|uniref:Malto-oligosyltrehalose trehalohydrolase n=1 Tax=Halochromatium glycolicum TaxID=85075 RepID=A0AAJ0U6X9_9GAMM|nr:malto-oligosyltrehalose trehalohydrolase [Halochromatium glycolicum]MBK1706439.1 malto-oligosyltrehalose trehalohydrolase [Halochromatium glycolicum]
MSTSKFRMPFGAECQTDGSVRFRLWAPAADQVVLRLFDGDEEQDLRMDPAGDGWLELRTDQARPGMRYAFRIAGRIASERVDGQQTVPDPASRFQPSGVHGPSEIIEPNTFRWPDGEPWRGRPWEEAVCYELHIGTFSAEGTFAGALKRLDQLAELGITALELMPVAAFPGQRNWGYDGVLPFAPDASYGRPEDLKALVQAAHDRGLMILLDVVYNHFGPEGNYLHLFAPPFFNERHQTPWGAAINFDGPDSRSVRDFFIQNALYWLEEFRFDGLRLDAVHAIADDSEPDILTELAEAVQEGPGRRRQVHLVLENERNGSRYLARRPSGMPYWYQAQWNDDFHHAAHVLMTGEQDGYYSDYTSEPARLLARCLAEGFAYQGEPSAFRDGARRGEPSAGLPPSAFINLLQNHDQVGNRAFGERIATLAFPEALRALSAVMLLAPSPPLLFMGQEYMTETPFLFFCDFGDDLADSVTDGRRREFQRFERFADPQARESIPDPNDPLTFERCRLPWEALERDARHREWRHFHQELLRLRHREIIPRLAGIEPGQSRFETFATSAVQVQWRLGDGAVLTLTANLSDAERCCETLALPRPDEALFLEPTGLTEALAERRLPPWAVAWHLDRATQRQTHRQTHRQTQHQTQHRPEPAEAADPASEASER